MKYTEALIMSLSISREGILKDIFNYFKQPNGVHILADSNNKYNLEDLYYSFETFLYYVGYYDDYKENQFIVAIQDIFHDVITKIYNKKLDTENSQVVFNKYQNEIKQLITKHTQTLIKVCGEAYSNMFKEIKAYTENPSTLSDYFSDGKVNNIFKSYIYTKYLIFHKKLNTDKRIFYPTYEVFKELSITDIMYYETINSIKDIDKGIDKFCDLLLNLVFKSIRPIEDKYVTKGLDVIQNICTNEIKYYCYPKGSDINHPDTLGTDELIKLLNNHNKELKEALIIDKKEK